MTPDERDDQKYYTTLSARSGSNGPRKDKDQYGIEAGNQYDEDVREFVQSGRVDPAAQEARRSVEGPDGASLHQAETRTARVGAMPGDPPWMAKVREAAHHAVDVVLSAMAKADDWVKTHSAKSSYGGDGRPDSRR